MRDDICQRLGANIRAHRMASTWTLNEFSKLLGVSYQQLQKYEKGANRMPITMAVRVAGIFKCSLDELCGLRASRLDPATASIARRLSAIPSPAVQQGLTALLEILEASEAANPQS